MKTASKGLIGNFGEYVKNWSPNEVVVDQARLGSREMREVVMRMLRTATRVLTILSVTTTFISLSQKWSPTFATDAIGSVNDSSIGQVIYDGDIELRGIPTERLGIFARCNTAG